MVLNSPLIIMIQYFSNQRSLKDLFFLETCNKKEDLSYDFTLGYSRKNPPNRGDVRTWNCEDYWRKCMWKLQGSIKKEVEFPEVFKGNSCGVSMGLDIFYPESSKGCHIISQNFQGSDESFLSPGFLRVKVENLKIPRDFSEKYILNPPVFIFSGIARFANPFKKSRKRCIKYCCTVCTRTRGFKAG